MHYKHWTRQQAIDYFKANAAKTETDIVNEIDRYIAWPGQALSYMIGQLELERFRREAEARLGDGVSMSEFHDRILELGSLPLPVLQRELSVQD